MSGKIELIHHHELISFGVALQDIQLKFGPLVIEMHSEIEIVSPNGSCVLIKDVWNREGDLNALWPLIGKQLERLIADEDSFRLIFDDGTMIRRKYELANELVNFWGPEPDAFTSYPNHLTQPAGLHYGKDEILNMLRLGVSSPNRSDKDKG